MQRAPVYCLTDNVSWRDDVQGLEAWQAGKTGFPIVDAAMRQLNATGWMHNRLRMIAASFLVMTCASTGARASAILSTG